MRALKACGFRCSATLRLPLRANLRRFFEVDRYHIAHAAIAALAAEGKMNAKDVARAIKQYKIEASRQAPTEC